MNRRWIVTIVFLLTLTGLFIWMGGRQVVTIAHIALADEQTAIFEDMVNQASKVLSDSPPNVRQAVEYLQYAHHYYPSGTKQTTGTRLDQFGQQAKSSSRQVAGSPSALAKSVRPSTLPATARSTESAFNPRGNRRRTAFSSTVQRLQVSQKGSAALIR